MKDPKISVIIPVYNAEKTLGNILEKLISQSYQNIEIITVNDGSKDASLKILEEFAEKDTRLIVIDQENAGVSAARNVGLNKATGEFVIFIDSDDDFSEELIAKLVEASSDDVNFVVCGMSINERVITSPEATVHGRKKVIDYVLKSLLVKNLLYGPCCKIFRRSIIERHDIHFPLTVKYGEDTIFVLNYLRHSGNLRSISTSLYRYRFTDQGLSSSNVSVHSFRVARVQALSEYMDGAWTLRNSILYLLLRFRWKAAELKARTSHR